MAGCDYECKKPGTLTQHKAYKHDIDVIWHKCDVNQCTYEAKDSSSLTAHLKTQHNDEYVARQKIQEERVRKMLVETMGLSEWFATANVPPIGTFKREKRIDFKCANVQSATQYARIDFAISLQGGLVFLEVDENQHQYGYDGLLSCDMKRMSHVMESLAIELQEALPHIYWLRYNPNAWHVDGVTRRVPKLDREARLARFLMTFECTGPLGIGYAFYDVSDGRLEVLDNEHYNPLYAEVAENLGGLRDEEEEEEEEEDEKEELCEECMLEE